MAQKSGRLQVFESLEPRQQRSMLVGILVLVAIVMAVVNSIVNGETDWRGLTDNFSTELLGAALTFLIFDLFQERRSKDELKHQLIRDMRSQVNSVALSAVEELRAYGWLKDGSLKGALLTYANLKGADLHSSKLQGARLEMTNLRGTKMVLASLQRASLGRAKLQKANLILANLEDADMRGVNLKGANLERANLVGARLWDDNFEDEDKLRAKFNENTILPDDNPYGERSFWTVGIDMSRFTDPNHPEFWRSPAYRDDNDDT